MLHHAILWGPRMRARRRGVGTRIDGRGAEDDIDLAAREQVDTLAACLRAEMGARRQCRGLRKH